MNNAILIDDNEAFKFDRLVKSKTKPTSAMKLKKHKEVIFEKEEKTKSNSEHSDE
jgi:hypothetical protein